ncbi:thiamine pyrophosphate-binding protein [Roseibium sp.]|uniref:thiamine pyrophosphate-binding protein n=1 Tax=Roseibium sp. TaxID=1936156 RepID=UPI003B526B23
MSKALENKTLADAAMPLRSGGRILADQLALLGADKIFCVPGESFLGLLEGLYAHQNDVEVITCRHESGAANMADAYGKMTGKPGIVAVTRGPGATNASNGVHTAYQDSTPMIVLIGQVGREMMDREAFQEMDYRRMFGEMAKWVTQIDDARRIPEYLSRAWKVALSGRPGPVVLALPEDMLTEEVATVDLKPTPLPVAAPQPSAMADLEKMLHAAQKPLLVVGGPGWNKACCDKAVALSERFGLPVATSFRCQDYFDNSHENYVGVIGIAPSPKLRKRVMEDVDLMIAIGPRFGEMTTQGYTLLDIPTPQMKLVHIHPGAEELGQVYAPELSIVSSPEAFLDAALNLKPSDCASRWQDWRREQNVDYRSFIEPTSVPGNVNMADVIRHLTETMPANTIVANGAGNYTVWVHRFHQHTGYRTQLAPTSGSMGYSQPAAIAAKLIAPSREVISIAGDGCFMMAGQELATARQFGADVIYIVVNNGMFGTIRMHQERNHPGHVIATELVNPDFVTYAKAFGIGGERITDTQAFPAALGRARASKGGYLIEIVVDPEALTPSQSLSDARRQGEAALAH